MTGHRAAHPAPQRRRLWSEGRVDSSGLVPAQQPGSVAAPRTRARHAIAGDPA